MQQQKPRKRLRICAALAALCILPVSVFAATIQVTAQIGEPGCDLVEAIITANSNNPTGGCIANNGSFISGGQDLIVLNFDAPISEFVVNSINSFDNGLPSIATDIRIVGRGGTDKVVIKRSEAPLTPDFRLLTVTGSGRLSLENISIQNGKLPTIPGSPKNGGAIQVQGGQLEINNSEFINNQGVVGGALYLSNADESIVTVHDSLFLNNRSTSDFSGGGAILSGSGDLTIINSEFIDNHALTNGGAIRVTGDSTNVIRQSLFTDNASEGQGGGAIHVGSNATISIYDSTISNNTANFYGGGIGLEGGSNLSVSITNTTISDNLARRGGGIGLDSLNPFNDSNLNIVNSLVSGNSSTNTFAPDQEISFGPQPISRNLQNNLIGHSGSTTAEAISGNFVHASNILATSDGDTPTTLNNVLLPLADNGGATRTHALPQNSPAIDAATDGTVVQALFFTVYVPGCRGEEIVPAVPLPPYRPDQRGIPRPIGSACDIGAYEYEPPEDACYVIKAKNNNVVTFCL